MVALRTGDHAQRAIGQSWGLRQAQRNRRGASANFQTVAGLDRPAVDAAESGAGIGGAAAEHGRQIEAAMHREVADAALQVTAVEDFVFRQRQAAPVAGGARLTGGILDARREFAGQGEGDGLRRAQARAAQADFEGRGGRRIAGQRVGDGQPFGVERAGQRHAEVSVAGAAAILEAGRQRRVEDLDHGIRQ